MLSLVLYVPVLYLTIQFAEVLLLLPLAPFLAWLQTDRCNISCHPQVEEPVEAESEGIYETMMFVTEEEEASDVSNPHPH